MILRACHTQNKVPQPGCNPAWSCVRWLNIREIIFQLKEIPVRMFEAVINLSSKYGDPLSLRNAAVRLEQIGNLFVAALII